MRCLKCGVEIDDTAKFCHKCGTPVTSTAVSPAISVNKKSRKDSYLLVGGLLGVALIMLCVFGYMKNYYARDKCLEEMVAYINNSQYAEAMNHCRENPFIEKDSWNRMDVTERQISALYYYADYIEYVKDISEEEMLESSQGSAQAKYESLMNMKGYLSIDAKKNIELIHDELTACLAAGELVDDCYNCVFDGVELMEDIRSKFLNKRKSIEEECNWYTVKELSDMRKAENERWKEYKKTRDETFEKLEEETEIDVLGVGMDYSLERNGEFYHSVPMSSEIWAFFDEAEYFLPAAGTWITKRREALKEQFPDYSEESRYSFIESQVVSEPLPKYAWYYEKSLVGNMNDILELEKEYDGAHKEEIQMLKENATILWAQKSKTDLLENIIPNLSKITALRIR